MINVLWRPQVRRIFISYRREDSQWFSGRLADSLAAYFGDRRVFRDIDGIAGGADFSKVIDESLHTSDAVIVVIGRNWLVAGDEQGRRRLDQADDWVAQEVGTALAKGLPVFPVLVEDTPMPRADELPPALRPLARFNAISVGDSRWDSDTARLAKIVSLDIPSVVERRLRAINLLVATSLALAIGFLLSTLVWNLLHAQPAASGVAHSWTFADLFDKIGDGACRRPPDPTLVLLKNWHTAIPFMVMVPGSALMFAFARHVDAVGRWAFLGAACVGGGGTLVAFVMYFFVCGEFEAIVNFYCAMLLAPTMLALMSLSGFRAR